MLQEMPGIFQVFLPYLFTNELYVALVLRKKK
jgi:hypothetical protein